MKKILITGANSYIGTSFEKYIKENYPNDYAIDTVDMIDGSWREKDFSGYDSVFHVAGIAHQKETKKNAELYYKVNRDLAIEAAQKAKNDGVKQFVFLSSMSVYGLDTGVITKDTVPKPKSNYGKSKLQAEEGIVAFADENFKVCVIRPPMVYGPGCKGNYQTLVKISRISPFFANYINKRSMISIENLSKFVCKTMDKEYIGLFCPQDPEYVCTCKMIQKIAETMGKNIKLLNILNPIIWALKCFTKKGKKAFSDLIYVGWND